MLTSAQRLHQFKERTFPFWKTIWRYFRDARGLLALGFNMVCGLTITGQAAAPKYLTDSVLLSSTPGPFRDLLDAQSSVTAS